MLSLKVLRSAAFAVLLSAGGAGLAQAADILRGAPPPPPLEPPPALDVGSGFYLRGDVGAAIYDHANIRTIPPLAGLNTVDSSIDSSAFIGIGAGYQFNSFLRADITGEYRFTADHRHTDAFVGGGNLIKGSLDGFVGLANVYVDLGTWHRVTPFVGAGIGMASMRMGKTSDYQLNTGGTLAATGPAKTTTQFAWAIHAGLGYDLGANWKAELAYRYLRIGDLDGGSVNCAGGGGGCPYVVRIKDLASHDIKLGVRYLFADAAPAFAPGPLVRKY